MKLDFNPQTASYNPMYQYFSSKMAIQNWTNRLARKLKKVNVISVNVNPGMYVLYYLLAEMNLRNSTKFA